MSKTVQTLRDNTYVDYLMKAGNEIEEIRKFKSEPTKIPESAKFSVQTFLS